MTPAVKLLQQHKIDFQLHEYTHDPATQSFGMEAAECLGVEPARVFKTLVAELDQQELVVGIVPVSGQLSTKALASSMGGKKARMADKNAVMRSSGYIVGGVSPLAQKKQLRTVLDQSADHYQTIFVSGGKRGLDIELAPHDLLRLCRARLAPIAQPTIEKS